MIRLSTLVFILMCVILPAFGQEKKDLAVSLSGGKMATPYYLNNTSSVFYCISFDYYLSKRHILSVNYFDGAHNYYDNILSTDPSYHKSDGTNAKANYH